MIRRIRVATQRSEETNGGRGEAETRRRVPASPRRSVVAPRRRRIASALHGVILDFREGLGYVRGIHLLSSIFIVAAGWGLGNGVARSLYSIFGARLGEAAAMGRVADPKSLGNSVLYFAMGFGGVLGAPIARRLASSSRGTLGARMGRSMILDGLCLALFTMMPSLWSASLVLVLRELNYTVWKTAQMTLIMSRTDDRYGGRVFASYETLTTIAMVGSMLVAGAAADTYGIRSVAAAGGIVIAFSGALWFVLMRTKKTD
jgi:hypothetical protein